MVDRQTKWRLILGNVEEQMAEGDRAHELDERQTAMDQALEALYDSDRQGGLGSSSPSINRWLGDIRNYFPLSVVEVIQKDALQRLDLTTLLEEPEFLNSLVPDVHLAATLISLKKQIPEHTIETARQIIRDMAKSLQEKLREPVRSAIQGAVNKSLRRRQTHPKAIDWNKTILANLSNYQPKYKTVIPEKLYGYETRARGLQNIQILVDQSGSMSSSAVYSGILAGVLASIPAVNTRFVVFDTSVVDLTNLLHYPVELLFGLQIGGGTDICKALKYGASLIHNPAKTTVVLISDLYDWSGGGHVVAQVRELKLAGANVIVLPALNNEGSPEFNRQLAGQLAALNVPVFACTPEQFPGLMAVAINRDDINQWMAREGITPII